MITFASYIQIQNGQFYTSALWWVDDKGSVVVGRELARPIRRWDQFDVVVVPARCWCWDLSLQYKNLR